MDRVERLYQKLATAGLRKGNDLQFLSHILSLKKDVREELLVAKCTNIWNLLKQEKVKSKTDALPSYRATSVTRGRRKRDSFYSSIY